MICTSPTMLLMSQLPPCFRSPDTERAVQQLQEVYFTALNMLIAKDFEAHRLHFYIDAIAKQALPLLEVLEDHAEFEKIPAKWFYDSGTKLSTLLLELLEAEKTALGQ